MTSWSGSHQPGPHFHALLDSFHHQADLALGLFSPRIGNQASSLDLLSYWSESDGGKAKKSLDCRRLSVSVAKTSLWTALSDLLLPPRETVGRYVHPLREDLVVATGRGRGDSRIKLTLLKRFLENVKGPRVVEVEANRGRLVISKEGLQRWVRDQRRREQSRTAAAALCS